LVAPLAESVAVWPGQIDALLTVIVGVLAMVTVEVTALLHPPEFVPLTVYTVVDDGETVRLELVAPVLQE
jgi:hypothetical protein